MTRPAAEVAAEALLARHGPLLMRTAARSIRHGLQTHEPLPVVLSEYGPELGAPGAVFVTLDHGGQLRGCIGSPQAHRPLIRDVAVNAFAAAFKDPRFKPLTAPELDGLQLSLSLLSPPVAITFLDQDDLLARVRPGIDGLILADRGHRGLFLPSVWEQIPEPALFLAHLKRKAGLPADHWSPTVQVARFTSAYLKQAEIPDGDRLFAVGV